MNDPLQRTKDALDAFLDGELPREKAIYELVFAARKLVEECDRALDEGGWA